MRGLIGGIATGTVAAVVGISAVSLLAPPPGATQGQPQASAPASSETPAIGSLPEASEFDSAGSVRAPQLGTPAGAPIAQGAAPPVSRPESAEPEPPMVSTVPPARPEAGAESVTPQTAPDVASAALDAAPEPEAPVPVPPPGEVETPALPQAETAAPAAPSPEAPGTEMASTAPAMEPGGLPEIAADPEGGVPALPGAETALPRIFSPGTQADPQTEPQAGTGPEIVLLPDGSPVAPATPELPRVFRPDGSATPNVAGTPATRFSDAAGVRVNRLPTIGAASPSATGEGGALVAPDVGAVDAAPLRRFASSFVPEAGKPLFAVVLIDSGEAAGGLDRTTIKTMGLPVTIAIDPERPDAAEAAEEYRAAGFEVAILARPLPRGATAADLEIALEDWHRKLPEAVALAEPATPLIQNNRALAQQLTKALAREGLGLITQAQGLNAAAQIAGSEGLPEAEIWRVLDEERDDAPVIERTLARAAFEAQREGHVAVMISSWPQSIAGLMSWASAERKAVTVAPATALMQVGAF